MIRTIKKILFFVLAPIPLLYIMSQLVDKGLQKSKIENFAVWNDLFQSKINADVLVCGASRACVQISPLIIDSILHVNSYNIGLDGSIFEQQYDLFQIYLQHNKKPRFIIHTFEDWDFEGSQPSLTTPEQYLPYLKRKEVVTMVRKYKSYIDNAYLYLPMYKYNNKFSLIFESVKVLCGHGGKPNKYKGYAGVDANWDSTAFAAIKYHIQTKTNKIQQLNTNISTDKLKLLTSYIEYCKQNNIDLILVFPPVYKGLLDIVDHPYDLRDSLTEIAKRNDILFLDHIDDVNFSRDPLNFYNTQHLNRSASERFTAVICSELKHHFKL